MPSDSPRGSFPGARPAGVGINLRKICSGAYSTGVIPPGRMPHMISWHRELETAATPAEVVYLTRHFLANLSAPEIARLPEAARPEWVQDARDIREWRRLLTEEYWTRRGLGGDVGVIQEIWSFFLRASIQLDRIAEESTTAAHR